MDILAELIASMNKEDARFYKLYAGRTRAGDNRKDMQLFELLREKGENGYDDDELFAALYGGAADKNSYYRMKNHLFEEVSKSIFIQHFKKDDEMLCYYLISQARYYFMANRYKLARYYLRKAEKQAVACNNLYLLDIVYSKFTKLAQAELSEDPAKYVQKRKEIGHQLNKLRQIDSLLAEVTYRLKTTQNYLAHDTTFIAALERMVKELSEDESVVGDPSLRLKLYEAVSKVLLQKRDYALLEEYVAGIYKQFSDEELFTRSTHNIKLQMLAYLANACFKNGNYSASLAWAEELKENLLSHGGLHREKFLFYYYNALVINYSVLDIDKAISTLEEMEGDKTIKKDQYAQLFIHLNLCILWHDKESYRNAIKHLNKLYTLESYKVLDKAFQLKIAVVEGMIRCGLNDPDYLEATIKKIHKGYSSLLDKKEFLREKQLLGFMLQLYVKEGKIPPAERRSFLKKDAAIQGETELINYNKWLEKRSSDPFLGM
jgi:hypothetical protein